MQRQSLSKKLTEREHQAFLGAYDFYRFVIPASMVAVISAHIQILLAGDGDQQKAETTISRLQFLILVAFSVVSYIIAFKFYKKCNAIDTTPIISPTNAVVSQSSSQAIEMTDQLLGSTKPQKYYCGICKITCDYRTRHCRKCSVCIERYDHHCFWIGNCVGRHNHRQFYYFLLAQTINNLLLFAMIYQLQKLEGWERWAQLGAGLLAFGFCCFTGYLLLYHTMLVSCGITTWQHMRRGKISYLKYLPSGHNPFSQGIFNNWEIFLTEATRATGSLQHQELDNYIVSFEESKRIVPGFNIIENEYYSCC